MCAADPGVVLGLYRSRHQPGIFDAAHRLGVRTLDTAYNYHRFGSHRALRRVAGDVLAEFDISTKVGFFPGDGGEPFHSLAPGLLTEAVQRAVDDLGQTPALVLLHNPERTLETLSLGDAADQFGAAAAVLQRAVDSGLAASWGVSTWHADRVLRVVAEIPKVHRPRPHVAMVRAGLLVSGRELEASERLARLLGVNEVWGMSPFGGDLDTSIWAKVDSRMFMAEECSARQAAFRVAAELPRVDQVVVGTDSPDHLVELVTAATVRPDMERVAAYRDLLRSRATRTPQPTS